MVVARVCALNTGALGCEFFAARWHKVTRTVKGNNASATGQRRAMGAHLPFDCKPVTAFGGQGRIGENVGGEPDCFVTHNPVHGQQFGWTNDHGVVAGADSKDVAGFAVFSGASEGESFALTDRVGVGAVVSSDDVAVRV